MEGQTRKLPKARIEFIGYRVHLNNGSITAKTEEQAKQIAKEMEKKAQEKDELENNEENLRIRKLEKLNHNIGNYVDYLKKKKWHLDRSDTTKKEKEEMKERIKILRGIWLGTTEVVWHQSYFNDTTSYTIEDVKKEEEE